MEKIEADRAKDGGAVDGLVVESQTTRTILETEDYNSDYDSSDEEGLPPQPKKTRRRKYVMARRVEGGELERIQPTESFWYTYYVQEPLLDDERFVKKFRNRFRLPYDKYKELCSYCSDSELFVRWIGKDATGRDATPITLLVLGSLRYLGRGWTFDDVEEATAVSKEVHRTFFHKFIEFGSTTLYEKYVVFPTTFEEAKKHMHEFAIAGLPGAMGSTDATHILLWNCEYNLRNNHLGGKKKNTSRSYNMTVNHRRRILHTTRGGPGRWNDQTMVMFDEFVRGMYDGDHPYDVEFELLERQNGKIISVPYRGGYVIVDNGYLRWSCTVPPFKVTEKTTELRWSKWVESMKSSGRAF